MTGAPQQAAGDRRGHGATPRWVVGIAMVPAVFWATYLLLSEGERGRPAAALDSIDTAPGTVIPIVQSAAGDGRSSAP